MNEAYHTEDPVSTLDRANPTAVRHFIETANPADLARYLDELDPNAALQSLLTIPLLRRTKVFSYMRLERQAALALMLDPGQLAEIVTEMNADDRPAVQWPVARPVTSLARPATA